MSSLLAKTQANKRLSKRTYMDDRRVLSVFDAAGEGKLDDLRYILEDNPSAVYKTHEDGLASALHYAARAGHADCVRLLLDYKAPVNGRTKSSDTPLHFAAEHGHVDVVRVLLERGADPTLTNYYRVGMEPFRDTPRQTAEHYKQTAVVQLLDDWTSGKYQPASNLDALSRSGSACL